jgi:glutathione synthase/RimK-type ligase-like ATP-grasp enzyme
MKSIILLLTHSQDYYTVDLVGQAVSQQGYRPVRVNLDEFPQKVQLSMDLKGEDLDLLLEAPSVKDVIRRRDIRAVWLRKVGATQIDEEMEPLLRNGCIRESREALDSFLFQLEKNIPWVDRYSVIIQASNKLYQQRLAQSVGLPIPKTLITNQPREVRAFFKELKGNMVTKMLTPLTISMSGNTPFVYTSRVKAEDLDRLDQLKYSPMVFQEFIPKAFELRIAYVNGKLFTGALHTAPVDGKESSDWRKPGEGDWRWEHYRVSEEWAAKITAFMKKIGLYFGALDVIVGPGGEFTFLEVNPTGEWGMLERDLELPISKAIADTLIELSNTHFK